MSEITVEDAGDWFKWDKLERDDIILHTAGCAQYTTAKECTIVAMKAHEVRDIDNESQVAVWLYRVTKSQLLIRVTPWPEALPESIVSCVLPEAAFANIPNSFDMLRVMTGAEYQKTGFLDPSANQSVVTAADVIAFVNKQVAA